MLGGPVVTRMRPFRRVRIKRVAPFGFGHNEAREQQGSGFRPFDPQFSLFAVYCVGGLKKVRKKLKKVLDKANAPLINSRRS